MITSQTNQYQIDQAKAGVAEFQEEVARIARVISYFQRVPLPVKGIIADVSRFTGNIKRDKRAVVKAVKSNVAPIRRRSA